MFVFSCFIPRFLNSEADGLVKSAMLHVNNYSILGDVLSFYKKYTWINNYLKSQLKGIKCPVSKSMIIGELLGWGF